MVARESNPDGGSAGGTRRSSPVTTHIHAIWVDDEDPDSQTQAWIVAILVTALVVGIPFIVVIWVLSPVQSIEVCLIDSRHSCYFH